MRDFWYYDYPIHLGPIARRSLPCYVNLAIKYGDQPGMRIGELDSSL